MLPPLTPPPSMALLTGGLVSSTAQPPSDQPALLDRRAATDPIQPVTPGTPLTPVSKYSSMFLMSPRSPKKKEEGLSQSQFVQEQELCTSPSWSEYGSCRSEKREKKKLERERKELEKRLKKEFEKQQKAAKAAKRLSKRPPPLKTDKGMSRSTGKTQSTSTVEQFNRRMTLAEIPSPGILNLPEIASLGALNLTEVTSPSSLKSAETTSPGSMNLSELTTPGTSMESSPRLQSPKPDTLASSSASSFETAPKNLVRHSSPPNQKGIRNSPPPNFSRPTAPGTSQSSRSNSSTDLSSLTFTTAPSAVAEVPANEAPPRRLHHTRSSTSDIVFQGSPSAAASAGLPHRRLCSSKGSTSETSPTFLDTPTSSQEAPEHRQRSYRPSAAGRANPANRVTWTVGKRGSELNNRKPVGKTFFICCNCFRWHDMPVDTFERLMKPTAIPVPLLNRDEAGSAGPSPCIPEGKKPSPEMPTSGCSWCSHEMTSNCCAAWTTVVYFHTRHC